MPKSIRHQSLLAGVAALVFFANLGGAHLWDVDEAIFSQAAKEMFARGDSVVPYFNGHLFPDKPAMMYWLLIGAYEMFGPTEFAARFWSAAFGVASVLVTYRLGRLMFSPAAGFWAALVLATNLSFTIIARAATPDSFLTFFSTLAVLLFVWGSAKARPCWGELNERNAPWVGQTRFEPSWGVYALMYAAMGCAVLTKGPIGVVLPTAVIGLFLLVMRAGADGHAHVGVSMAPFISANGVQRQLGWRGALSNSWRWLARVFNPLHILHTVWSMRPLTAIAVVLAVAGPWYVLVGLRTDGQWLVGFFGTHNFGRFLNAMENHRGPIFYYLVAIAVGFFPWSVLFGPSLLNMKRQLAEGDPWRPGYVLACSWIAVWVGFFSLAGMKLPSYVVPAYPALALLTGALVDRWLREPALVSRLWTRLIWGTVGLAGVAMLVGLPIVAHLYLHDDWSLAALGLMPLVAAIAGMVLSESGRVRPAIGTLATLGVALMLGVFAFGAARVDRHQDSPWLAAQIAARTATADVPTIGSYGYFRPSFVFYTDRPIAELESREEVCSFFDAHPQSAFLITTDEQYAKLCSALPPGVGVLDTHSRFLRPGKAVLLGRAVETRATATKGGGHGGSALQ